MTRRENQPIHQPKLNIAQQSSIPVQQQRPPMPPRPPVAQPGMAQGIATMMKWLILGMVVFVALILLIVMVIVNFSTVAQGGNEFLKFVFDWLPTCALVFIGGLAFKFWREEILAIVQFIWRAILYSGPSRRMAQERANMEQQRVKHLEATTKQVESATKDKQLDALSRYELALAAAEEKRALALQKHRFVPTNENGIVFVTEDGRPIPIAMPQRELPPNLHNLTMHNAPRITGVQQEAVPQIEAGQEAPHVERPRIEQFYETIPYNSRQTGLGADVNSKRLITAVIEESTHFKFVGGSGQGKSCVAAAALDIAINTNDCDHLRIGLLDMEHNTSRLFEDDEHVAELGPRRVRLIGRNPDEVANRIHDLYQELKRRSELGEAYCSQHEPLLLVYVEELLALKFEVDESLKKRMIEHINIIGVRGRKYGIFLLACMQTDYSDKDMREGMAQFRTRGAFAIDPEVARASGFFNKELILRNFRAAIPGRYVLEKNSYAGIVLAVSYDVKQKLAQLGASTTAPTTRPTTDTAPTHYETTVSEVGNSRLIAAGTVPTTGSLEAASASLTKQEKRILAKLRQGMGMKQVIASEFTDTKGRPLTGGDLFQQKAQEIWQLVARYLPENEEER